MKNSRYVFSIEDNLGIIRRKQRLCRHVRFGVRNMKKDAVAIGLLRVTVLKMIESGGLAGQGFSEAS